MAAVKLFKARHKTICLLSALKTTENENHYKAYKK